MYVDDTLIVEGRAEIAQELMDTIRTLGLQYGLAFNESKLEVLSVNHDGVLYTEGGGTVKKKKIRWYLPRMGLLERVHLRS